MGIFLQENNMCFYSRKLQIEMQYMPYVTETDIYFMPQAVRLHIIHYKFVFAKSMGKWSTFAIGNPIYQNYVPA